MRFPKIIAIAALSMLPSASAFAHHSSVMFDRDKQFTLEGTVKEFQWTNPHSWLILVVPENGTSSEYSLEGQSPNILIRKGWRPSILNPGDKVTVVGHPLKDGTKGGQLVSVKTPDGTVLETSY